MREVHRPHLLVVNAVDGEVRQHASIRELAAFQVDLSPDVVVVDVVLAPLLLPVRRLECHWEGSRHLHGVHDWQLGSGLVVEVPENVVGDVDGSAGELDASDVVQLFHGQSQSPLLVVLLLEVLVVLVDLMLEPATFDQIY